MKKIKILFSLLIITTLTSCMATFNGAINNSTALSSANFTYAEVNVEGKADATYILGIGGLDRHSLISEAKQDLMSKHNLKAGQSLANIITNYKTSYYLGLVTVVECTVSADIVEFNK